MSKGSRRTSERTGLNNRKPSMAYCSDDNSAKEIAAKLTTDAMWTGSHPVVFRRPEICSPALTGSPGGTHRMHFRRARRIGQRIDDLHLLDDRAGPSVRDDERQSWSVVDRLQTRD